MISWPGMGFYSSAGSRLRLDNFGVAMFRILVDTCVWRHWFTLMSAPEKLTPELYAQAKSFDHIYRMVADSSEAEFLFNSLVAHELGPRYRAEVDAYIVSVARKVQVPLSRYDGLHLTDGSLCYGGRFGGALRALLNTDGYQQDAMVAKAASELEAGNKLYNCAPRKREIDVEHMECALESGANLFVTDDERTIISRLERLGKTLDPEHIINVVRSITRTPEAALPIVSNLLNP